MLLDVGQADTLFIAGIVLQKIGSAVAAQQPVGAVENALEFGAGQAVVVADAIELLPTDTVVARVTGDGMADELLAPDWSRKKVSVINDIDKLLYERGSYQGIKFNG